MSDLSLTLVITAVGMGLVFAAILLLWGVMVLLVRLAGERDHTLTAQAEPDMAELEMKRRAAAAAVAIALASGDDGEPHEFPLPPTALVSAWQAVNRGRMMNKRGQVR